MGGATKARLNDSKPILNGYYKSKTSAILLIEREGVDSYQVTINGYTHHYTTRATRVFIDSYNYNYLGSNRDSISLLYKE